MDIPRRPPVIIRAPARADKTPDKTFLDTSTGEAGSLSGSNKSPPRTDDVTVYTNTAVCRYSPDLLAAVQGCMFNHVDISKSEAPSWLPGTPTVVHKSNVYCGDAAFAFVQSYDLQKGSPAASHADEEAPNPFAKRPADNSFGCGLAKAFASPSVVEVDESKFAESTDDAMQRLLAGRR